MRFFMASLRVNVKNIMSPYSVFPVLFLAVSLLLGAYIERELIIQPDVGVFHSGSEISLEIIGNLQEFSNVNIIFYDDEDELLDDVAAHKVECGYVFSENVDRYIKNGTINRAAKLYKSPATVSDGFTNELVFAALLKTAAPYISANYLSARVGSSDLDDAKSTIKSYYDDDIFMEFQIVPVGGGSAERRQSGGITSGILSVFIFIVFLYCVLQGIEVKNGGLFEKLPNSGKSLYLASFFSAQALIILIITALPVLLLYGNPVYSVFVLLMYISFMAIVSFLAATCLKSAHSLYAAIPVIAASVIMLGGAFFDLGEIVPALGGVSRLFPTYYFAHFIAG